MHYQLDLQFQFLAEPHVEASQRSGKRFCSRHKATSDSDAGRKLTLEWVILAARAGPGLPRQSDLAGCYIFIHLSFYLCPYLQSLW